MTSEGRYNLYLIKKSLRKAWLPYFDKNISAVIFISSLSSYDEILVDDDNKNRMVDALELFNETVNHGNFAKLPFILLLNKIDLFERKLNVKIKIRDYFPDFKEHNNLKHGKEFFRLKFEKAVKNQDKKIFIRISS